MRFSLQKDFQLILALTALCAVVFGFALGKTGLMDPDEPFYALTAKEMVAAGDPWTPRMFGEPQFEKPIFFYWVLYACFRFFGVHEWSARLGPCLAGTAAVLVTYLWGRVLFRRKAPAFCSALVLASSGQFIVLSRIVLTDIFLCLFVTSALAVFSWGLRQERFRTLSWNLFFVFAALGFLTKGPLGLLIPLMGVVSYAVFSGERWILRSMPWAGGLLLFFIIGFPWYMQMASIHGAWFFKHFFVHENIRRFFYAEHGRMDNGFFYPFVLMFGFFPWSACVAAALWEGIRRGRYRTTRIEKTQLFLVLCLIVPFVFFSLAKSKLMSYIFPMYPAAALLAGFWLYRLHRAWGMGYQTSWAFKLSQLAVWGLAPVALASGAWIFSVENDLALKGPILAIVAAWFPLTWAALYFFWRARFVRAAALVVCGIMAFSSLAFSWMMPNANVSISTKTWEHDVRELVDADSAPLVLASKIFVRGAAYYGDVKNIGVFSSHPKGDFYTPHPIPIITDIRDFVSRNGGKFPVYFFIRNKEMKDLKNNLPDDCRISVLRQASGRFLVRLDHA